MADDTLQRLFQHLQGTRKQQSLTGNYQTGYAQEYAPYDAYFSNARQQAKENKGLALQERQVATGERAQAAQASQFAQSQSLYNKALSQQKTMGYVGLGANLLGTGVGYMGMKDKTNMMRDIYGRGGSQALTSSNLPTADMSQSMYTPQYQFSLPGGDAGYSFVNPPAAATYGSAPQFNVNADLAYQSSGYNVPGLFSEGGLFGFLGF